MKFDRRGNTLIKYEILDVISIMPCFTGISDTILMRVICDVQSEYGDVVIKHVTYWDPMAWEENLQAGYYFCADVL